MIDYLSIISKYYKPGDPDYELLVKHSTQVALLTRQLCQRYQAGGGEVDIEFAFEAAMLHFPHLRARHILLRQRTVYQAWHYRA